jgi:hypothetical protein
MGWKGALRSIQAAARAAEREERRRQRELERQQKSYARMQELEQAALDVQLYENHIGRLISLHKECADTVQWAAIASAQPPKEPMRGSTNEEQARRRWSNYQPSLWDKLLRQSDRKRESLFCSIEVEKKSDEEKYQKALKRFNEKHAEWEESRKVARRILAGDPEAYTEAIRELDPFGEISDLGSRITFEIHNPKVVEAILHVHGEQVIPKEQKSLLKSRKLSVKEMPASKFYQLYQDYVCSAALRVARDTLAILPVPLVISTAYDNLLNAQTGHLEEQPILSVAISRQTLEKLNLEAIDPSDSMRNFVHRMNFMKTKGFSAVERIAAAELALH